LVEKTIQSTTPTRLRVTNVLFNAEGIQSRLGGTVENTDCKPIHHTPLNYKAPADCGGLVKSFTSFEDVGL